MNALLTYSKITLSYGGKPSNNKAFGFGIFLLFTDIIDVLPFSPLKVYAHQTVFTTNYEDTPAVLCLEPMKNIPITYASVAGLTVYYIQKKFAAEVNILQSHFISNYGVSAGAVRVMYFNSVTQSKTVISNTISPTLIYFVLDHTLNFFMSVTRRSTTIKMINFFH